MKKSTLFKMTRPHPIKAFLDRITHKFMNWVNNLLLAMTKHPFFGKFVKLHEKRTVHPFRNLSDGVMYLGTVSDSYMTWTATGIFECVETSIKSNITIFDRGHFFEYEQCWVDKNVRCKLGISRITVLLNGEIKEIEARGKKQWFNIYNPHTTLAPFDLYDGNTKQVREERVVVNFSEVMGYNFRIPATLGSMCNMTEGEVIDETMKYVRSSTENNYKLYREVFDKCVIPNDLTWITPIPEIRPLRKE